MLFWVALGGASGSMARYLIGSFVQRSSENGFPAGTLSVNIVGCFLVGILMQYFTGDQPQPAMRALLVIGFCGGFTTFSAFTAEVVEMASQGQIARASVYAILSVTLSILATAAGLLAARSLILQTTT